MYPEKLKHHFKQWIRWMRATLIRDCWRLRYLPLSSYGWWFTFINTIAFLSMTGTLILVAARWPVSAHYAEAGYLAMCAWASLSSLRLLAVRRSDENWLNRLGTLFYYPMALLWGNLVLRPFELAAEVFRLLSATDSADNPPERSVASPTPTTSAAYRRPAPRPAYSVLGHDAWAASGIAPIGDWRDALCRSFPAILADDAPTRRNRTFAP